MSKTNTAFKYALRFSSAIKSIILIRSNLLLLIPVAELVRRPNTITGWEISPQCKNYPKIVTLYFVHFKSTTRRADKTAFFITLLVVLSCVYRCSNCKQSHAHISQAIQLTPPSCIMATSFGKPTSHLLHSNANSLIWTFRQASELT